MGGRRGTSPHSPSAGGAPDAGAPAAMYCGGGGDAEPDGAGGSCCIGGRTPAWDGCWAGAGAAGGLGMTWGEYCIGRGMVSAVRAGSSAASSTGGGGVGWAGSRWTRGGTARVESGWVLDTTVRMIEVYLSMEWLAAGWLAPSVRERRCWVWRRDAVLRMEWNGRLNVYDGWKEEQSR